MPVLAAIRVILRCISYRAVLWYALRIESLPYSGKTENRGWHRERHLFLGFFSFPFSFPPFLFLSPFPPPWFSLNTDIARSMHMGLVIEHSI